ncbi:unnamed protein product [Chrysoparadoxa australica]
MGDESRMSASPLRVPCVRSSSRLSEHRVVVPDIKIGCGGGEIEDDLASNGGSTSSPSPPTTRREGSLEAVCLPRGGSYIPSCIGAIQIGIPPETIKDSLAMGLAVPQYYVLPKQRFHRELDSSLGINVAEFEFPAYYNYFLKNQKVVLVVENEDVETRIRAVLQETLFGPLTMNADDDCCPSMPEDERPDLHKETNFFRVFNGVKLTLDSLVKFARLDDEGKCKLTAEGHGSYDYVEISLVKGEKDSFIVRAFRCSRAGEVQEEGNVSVGAYVVLPERHPRLEQISSRSKEFTPPDFGVTVLGNSHGFDPAGTTSGYVLWINRRGYMIDPPPYASALLTSSGIRPGLIEGVVVTHCHADHDAGIFQKILTDGEVTVLTTYTIYESFIRKYAALSGIEASMLKQSHQFCPVVIGQPLNVRGASMSFFYTLHSIPCIGFEVTFRGKGITFSADHMNDPEKIKQMNAEGIMRKGRMDDLLNFPWGHDVIFHEAGIPPIHTPMRMLEQLPQEVKDKLYVVHVNASSIPKGSGLRVAPVGVEGTITLDVPSNDATSQSVVNLLDIMQNVPMFSMLSIRQVRDLMSVAKIKTVEAQSIIQDAGTVVKNFCVVIKGRALARYSRLEGCTREDVMLTSGDWFGEEIMISGRDACKDGVQIVAISEVELIFFGATDLLWLLEGGKVCARAWLTQHLADNVLQHNSVLRRMTRSQMVMLEYLGKVQKFSAGDCVWEQGAPKAFVALIGEGSLKLEREQAVSASGEAVGDEEQPKLFDSDSAAVLGGCKDAVTGESHYHLPCPETFGVGALVGCAGNLIGQQACYSCTCRAVTDSLLLLLDEASMTSFKRANPGVFLAIHDLAFVT